MSLIKIERIIFYFSLNIFRPLLLPFFRYFKIFDFAVLVYPGNRDDIIAYSCVEFLKKNIPTISIIGFVNKSKNGKRGIVLAIKYYIEEIYSKKEEISEITKKFAISIGVKKIALVGRLPKILFDKKDSLFVEGKIGTVFTIIDSINTLISRLNLSHSKIDIGVIGIGFIGKEVLMNLKSMNFASVTAFDKMFEEDSKMKDNVKTGKDPSLLRKCNLLIVLTPRGDDILDLIPFFSEGVIILDDTHPFISKKIIKRIEKEKNGKIYKVAVFLSGVEIYPTFPGFKSDWIPGCIIETIVSLYDKKWTNQNQFNEIAHKIGFRAIFENISEE